MNNGKQPGDVEVPKWFEFKGQVVDQFDEHVSKSIPNYQQVINMIGWTSAFFIQNGSTYLDLGCSTCATMKSVIQNNTGKSFEAVGVDISREMIEKAILQMPKGSKPQFKVMDISKEEAFQSMPKSDLIVSSLLIQFLNTSIRQRIIQSIYDTLNEGGAFFWYEKSESESSKVEQIYKQYMNIHKFNSGLSADSILNKDDSLRGIMPTKSIPKNLSMLNKAGFRETSIMHKEVNFTFFIAIK